MNEFFISSDQSHTRSLSPSATHPSRDLKLLKTIEHPHKQKRTTENHLEKAASIVNTLIEIKRIFYFLFY